MSKTFSSSDSLGGTDMLFTPRSGISTFAAYLDGLGYEENLPHVRRMILNGVKFRINLRPNLASDWSVKGDLLPEYLGIDVHMYMQLTAEAGKVKKCLTKGSGNNQCVLDLGVTGWENSGIGDALYVDIVGVIHREIRRLYPELHNSPVLIKYLSYRIFDLIITKLTGNNTSDNAYGTVQTSDTELSLTTAELQEVVDNTLSALPLPPVSIHGEFRGATSEGFQHEAQRERESLGKIATQDKRLFPHLIQNDELKLESLYPYGCYPQAFTQGTFDQITTLYENEKFDLIIAKRSDSHIGDDAFYQGLGDTGKLLNPGGIYITDGIRQSYSRVLRMDPAKLREMLPTDQFDIYMNISGAPETSDTELKSLIIVRKGLGAEKNLNAIQETIAPGCRLQKWDPAQDEYQYIPEATGRQSQISVHRMHGILRDLIGIDPSQWPEDIHMERTKIACLSSDILDQLIGILNTKDRRKSEETVNTPLNQRERRNIPRETANRSYQRSVAREGITGIVRYVMNSVFDLLRKEQQRINKERKGEEGDIYSAQSTQLTSLFNLFISIQKHYVNKSLLNEEKQ